MIGLNAEEAKASIDRFEAAGMMVYDHIKTSNIDFITKLSAKWCSRRAVQEFAVPCLPEMFGAQNDILVFVHNMVNRAKRSFNQMAEGQGIEDRLPILDDDMEEDQELPTDTPEVFQVDGQNPFKEEFADQSSGMYVTDIETDILPEWNGKIQVGMNALSNIPIDAIALYDETGEIQNIYEQAIKKGKETLQATLDHVYKVINFCVDKEIDKSQQSASSANQSMNG